MTTCAREEERTRADFVPVAHRLHRRARCAQDPAEILDADGTSATSVAMRSSASRACQYTGAAVNQVARQMLKYLGEPDYPNVVQNALDIIEKLPLGKVLRRAVAQTAQEQTPERARVRGAQARVQRQCRGQPPDDVAARVMTTRKSAKSPRARWRGTRARPSYCWPRSPANAKPSRPGGSRKSSNRTASPWTRRPLKKFAALAARALEAGQPAP